MNEGIGCNSNVRFVNEIVMNEFTMQEIATDMWVYKRSKNKIPLLIFMIVVLAPMIYGFITGKEEFVLLAGILFLTGLACIFVYLGLSAYCAAKKRKQMIREIQEKYGDDKTLTVCIGETIAYNFGPIEKVVSFSDVEKIIELKTYLILLLKNGVVLPIWKIGFSKGEWNDFVPYFKQCMKNR